ncbi:MAG TPA: GNAT family N-acetyltransferase [Thermoanaerobaculia bacterium]|jgi:ribosomal protein S18 acetylase RimI-like enzyme
MSLPAAELARAERAHYRLHSALYLPERRDLAGVSLFASPTIPDPEWNHAALVAVDAAAWPARLAEIRRFFERRGRPATVAVSPFSRPADLAARLAGAGFAPSFRHRWFFGRDDDAPEASAAVEIVDGEERMSAFVDVFEAVFAEDPEPGYARALWRSWRHATVVHYLARVDGRPAGVASALHARGACGLYNLAVLPSRRRRGLGTALTARRLADARRRGDRLVFLQTEPGAVARRQRRNGLAPGFETVGWTALE